MTLLHDSGIIHGDLSGEQIGSLSAAWRSVQLRNSASHNFSSQSLLHNSRPSGASTGSLPKCTPSHTRPAPLTLQPTMCC